jgi:SAM-dependent methyltransferase
VAGAGTRIGMTGAAPLGGYYDRLSTWTRLARRIGYGGGDATMTVHRALADPQAGGAVTTTRLHDLLLEQLPRRTGLHVLDAGCGLGGTMLDLAARTPASFTGITLSAAQAARGRAAIVARGLGTRVAIRIGDYDAPPPGRFDAIIAIESLAHSRDPRTTVAALCGVLAHESGSRLIVVDDMPEPGAVSGRALDVFKRGWQCPVLWPAASYAAAFAAHGLAIAADIDLTPQLRPRGRPAIAALAALNRVAHALVPVAAWRMLMESHRGGLALERLYRDGAMRYRLLVAERR